MSRYLVRSSTFTDGGPRGACAFLSRKEQDSSRQSFVRAVRVRLPSMDYDTGTILSSMSCDLSEFHRDLSTVLFPMFLYFREF